ncbi:MAG: GTPase, partial [Kofleriaceae bacterium]
MITTWAKQLEEIEAASRAAADLLTSIGTPVSRSAAQAVKDTLAQASEAGAPTIALVGQYNAGKSSLIKALTSADVAISGDIETAKASAFKWRGLVLVDTPGVKAGRPEHDEETEHWLAKSDLLLFVITNELFDDVVGTYFRKLAYDQGRADLMMLVINKISREPNGAGAVPHMRPSLDRVLSPRTLEDYRCVALDVRSHLEAEEEPDEKDRQLLRERSRLSSLASALEAFGQEKRIMARALVPLSLAIQALEQARDELAAGEDVDRKDYLELLRRRALLLQNARARVEFNAASLIARHASEVSKYAQEILRLLNPADLTSPPRREELDEALAQASSKLELHAEKLSKELQASLAREIAITNEDLRGLGEGSLAKSLSERMFRFEDR